MKPNSDKVSFLGAAFRLVRGVVRWNGLIWELFKKEYFASYRRSILGYAWILLLPLANVVAWVIMQKVGVLQPGDTGVPYEVYVLIGATVWGLGTGIFVSAGNTLTDSKELAMQINYPHEVFALQRLLQKCADFLVVLVLYVGVLLLYKVELTWAVLLFPFALLPLIVFAFGMGMLFSLFNAVLPDIQKMNVHVLNFLMYMSPIMYTESKGRSLFDLVVAYNPLTHLVCFPRDLLLYGRPYSGMEFVYSSLLACFIFIFAIKVFYNTERRLIERL